MEEETRYHQVQQEALIYCPTGEKFIFGGLGEAHTPYGVLIIVQYHPYGQGRDTPPQGCTAAMCQFDQCVILIFVAVLFYTQFCVNVT